jgi:hypothetical protein
MDNTQWPTGSDSDPARRTFLHGITAGALGATVLSSRRGAAETQAEADAQPANGEQTALKSHAQSDHGALSIGGGSLGYAQAASTPSLNLSGGLETTIELWINHDGTSDADAVLLEKKTRVEATATR